MPKDKAQAPSPKTRGGAPGRWKLRLIILAITLLVLFLYINRISALAFSVRDTLSDTFGAGGIILIISLAALLWMLSKESVRTWLQSFLRLFRQWRWWLGGVAFFLAAFGILAFLELGGKLGQNIIQDKNATGVLRILALLVIGGLFVATRHTLRLLRALIWAVFVGLWHFFKAAATGLRAVFPRAHRHQPTPKVERPQPEPPAPLASPPPTTPTQETEATPPPVAKRPSLVKWLPPLVMGKKDKAKATTPAKETPPVITASGWELPPLSLLEPAPEVELRPVDNERRAQVIEEALASYGVEAKVKQINPGPTVTQFGVEPGWDRKYREVKAKDKNGNTQSYQEEVSRTRVKVERISSLANDLALALSAPTIRIEAPVPGKPLVGIEVPNTTMGMVPLRGVLESAAYQRLRAKSSLAIGLGKGAGGEAVVADLSKMPHLLIAGATGSGKTVFLHSVVCSLLMANTPDDLHFIIIDPKRVEMAVYSSLPHLAAPVLVEADKAVETLRWLNQQMDERYRRFAAVGARHIEDYNKKHYPPYTYQVLVIDELADLMMTAFEEVEQSLCRLAQLSRATGIHLVVATQRPSVDVVTGLIKANFPTRLSFAVTSQVDSRTILDTVGADKLLGRGDMLYLPTDAAKPKRLQGCFVSDAEMERLVDFWAKQRPAHKPPPTPPGAPPTTATTPADPLLEAARRLAREHKQVSASFLQRRLQIGYNRATQLMELLEKETAGEEPAKGPGDTGTVNG